jgi:hypothetical protein
MELFGFSFGGGSSNNEQKVEEQKAYVVPEDRAIGRPHMMGWLELLGEDEELGVDGVGGSEQKEETFEADKWEEVKA